MLEKPNLPDEKLIACVQDSYGLSVTGIEFLPIGNEPNTWVYRVGADTPYFLKVKRGNFSAPMVTVPKYLHDSGISQVMSPLPRAIGELWASLDKFTLILYPFVEGRNAAQVGMTDSQWIGFGEVLKRIHQSMLPPEIAAQVPRETFIPKWMRIVRDLHKRLLQETFDDPYAQQLAAIWNDKREEIDRTIEQIEAISRTLQNRELEFVLCHSDIHQWNMLIDKEGTLFIVDWDAPIFAPKERDLMFVSGESERIFFEGYGNVEVDELVLAYYRYEWVIQEFGDFGERVFIATDSGEETKADAVAGFRDLFRAGDVVDGASASEEN